MIPNVVHVNEKCVEKEQHTDDETVAKKRIKHLPSLGTHSFYHLFCTWFYAYAFVHSACTFHFYKLNFTFLQENIIRDELPSSSRPCRCCRQAGTACFSSKLDEDLWLILPVGYCVFIGVRMRLDCVGVGKLNDARTHLRIKSLAGRAGKRF